MTPDLPATLIGPDTPAGDAPALDDVLATGGTAAAACDLVERASGTVVAVEVVIELAALGGRAALEGRAVQAMVTL